MAGEYSLTIQGAAELVAELAAIAPELRRGPARRALVAGMAPVLAAAYAATPQLTADIYRRGHMIRKAGTLRRALKVRSSKDVNRTGDVGVFLNIKPLTKGQITDFKASTGRAGSQNPQDPYYWRWVTFATKRNHNPAKFLQKGGDVMLAGSLPLVTAALAKYFVRLNKKKASK